MHSATTRSPILLFLGILTTTVVLSLMAQASTEAMLGAPATGPGYLLAAAAGVTLGVVFPMAVSAATAWYSSLGNPELGATAIAGATAGMMTAAGVLAANILTMAIGGGAIVWACCVLLLTALIWPALTQVANY